MKTFNVVTTVTIGQERVVDLLGGAIEGGSNYWCRSITRNGGVTAEFRQDIPFVDGGWLEVAEDEPHDDAKTTYRLDLEAIERGLSAMATKFPKQFTDFVNENDDADTSDIFLQCCLFGDVIYG